MDADTAPGQAVACEGLRKAFGPVLAIDDVTLAVERGEILALLGPSGCGKTTFLRLVAGFERPDAGRLTIAGREVAGRRRFLPPDRRRIGFVFQDYALFPHLTVGSNVAYGIRGRDDVRVAEVLALVGLAGIAARYPHELSGGQQQRVALARALAPRPDIVLLDEPFSNLDADLRQRVRSEVRDILRAAGATSVFVTHDQEEAFSIADRIAVMRDGRVDQVATPEEIYHTPATRFVADFVGQAEFLPFEVSGDRLATELGSFNLGGIEVPDGGGELMIRPEDIALASDPTAETVVVGRRFQGPVNLTSVRLGSGLVVTAAPSSQHLFQIGEPVRVAFRPDHLVLFRGDERLAWIPARPRTGTGPPPR